MQGKNNLYSIILFSLLGISTLLGLLFAFDVVSEGVLLGWCYVLLGVSIIAAIAFSIINMVKDPKKAKSALIGFGALAIVFGIGYALAGSETYQVGEVTVGETVSKRSEGGLIAFYIMIIVAIGAIIYSEIAKAFK